jgi:hypothetical protein
MPYTFSNIDQLIKALKEDQEHPSRFPARVIFINSLCRYNELVNELKERAFSIPLWKYCKSNDTLPDIDEFAKFVSNAEKDSLIVSSMGEYLRLAAKVEKRIPKFASIVNLQQSVSKKRLWMPLYCSEHIFDKLVGEVDLRLKEHIYHFATEDTNEQFLLKVFSEEFEDSIFEDKRIGVQDWIKLWDDGIKEDNYILITGRHSIVEETGGIYSIKKVTNAFGYIKNYIQNADQLIEEWGNNKFWVKLSSMVSEARSVDELLLNALNINRFDPEQIFNVWSTLEDFPKWVFWVWFRLHNYNDYISYSMARAKSYEEIQKEIECAVFEMPLHNQSEWLKERASILKYIGVNKLCSTFWERFNNIDGNRDRLKTLTGNTVEEKKEIIKTVSRLLSDGKGVGEVIIQIDNKYPELTEYLKPTIYVSDISELNKYFDLYRVQKLKDAYDETIRQAVEDIKPVVWSFPTRGNILEKFNNKDSTYVLWIDGLGIEWISLLLFKVEEMQKDIKTNVEITIARIPTTTKENEHWKMMDLPYEKINTMDDISHVKDESAKVDYAMTVTKQFEAITNLARRIIDLLAVYNTLIVTADHGLSRMAALAFHKYDGVKLPNEAKVYNLGRYCIVNNPDDQYDIKNVQKDGSVLAFETHEHFSCKGYAPGEIHGGATPEELLVPVIEFKKTNRVLDKLDEQISCKISNKNIKPNEMNIVEVELVFNKPVNTLDVAIGREKGESKKLQEKRWIVSFENLDFKSYKMEVIADGLLISGKHEFDVKRRGLEIDELL